MKLLLNGDTASGSEQLYPYDYPQFMDRVKSSIANTWFPENISTGDDKTTYKTGLTEAERKVFETQFGALTFFDVNIPSPLALMLYTCTAPEVRQWIIRQLEEERNHQMTYQYCADITEIDSNILYRKHTDVPTLKAKATYARHRTSRINDYVCGDGGDYDLIKNMFFYSQVYEGMWFMGGFAPLLALAEQGKMINTSTQLVYIMRDETNHIAGWLDWLQLIQKELDVYLSEIDAIQIIEEALELESSYVHEELPPVLHYNPNIHMAWMRYLANVRLEGMGFKHRFSHATYPLWLPRWQLKKEQNFFEGHVTEYQNASALEGTW